MLGSKGDCEKTKLSDDEQTRHYICSQRGELVFVSTEDYQLGCVMRILRYLKKAPERGLRVRGFSDTDWAKCPFDRRSATGYCVFFEGNLAS